MNNEFKKTSNKDQTVYTLESASSGGTSSGSIASISSPMGGVHKRGQIVTSGTEKKVPATTPRNFVAKNAKTGGAGAHKDKKKAEKQGTAKHKKPYMEALQAQLDQLKSKVAEGVATTMPMSNAVKLLRQYGADHFKTTSNELHFYKNGRHLSVDLVMNPDTTRSVSLSSLNAATRGLKGQGVAEGKKENKHDLIPVKLLKRNVPYWLTYDFYGHGGEIVKLSGPHPTNNNYIIVKDQDGNKYNVSKGAVLFASDPNQNKGVQQGMAEGFNGEYDDEAGMAHSNLLSTARAVMGLLKTIKDRDNLPEWGQEKIAKAEMMLVGVWDYLQSQKELGNDPKVEGYGRYDRRDAYQRDYDHSVAGMDRGNNHRDDERHDLDPSDWYIVKDGKMFKVSVYPNQEQEAISQGYSRTRDEAKAKVGEQGVAEGDAYMESLQAMVERQLEPTMDLDAWNDNFQNADPQKYHQFKNKTPEKKK